MEDIRNFWGDRLQPVPKSAFEMIALPDETVELLTTVGLPVDPRLVENFGLGMVFKPEDAAPYEHSSVYYLVLGTHNQDADNLLMGLRAGDGQMWMLNTSSSRLKRHRRPDAFINTSFEQFLRCVMTWAEYEEQVTDFIARTEAMSEKVDEGTMSVDELTDTLNAYNKEGADLIGEILVKLQKIDAPAIEPPTDPKKIPFWYDLVAGVAPD